MSEPNDKFESPGARNARLVMADEERRNQRKKVCTLALDLLKATARSVFVQARDVDDFFEVAEKYYQLRAEYLDDQQPEDDK